MCGAVLLALAESGAAQEPQPDPLPDAPTWNQVDLGFTTLRIGVGLLFDMATYAQGEVSEEQLDLEPAGVMRDGRVLFGGKFDTSWPISWDMGIMYDEPSSSWRFRQSGIRVVFPGDWGGIFVGRQKEGISLVRVMSGYHGWGMERAPISDAFLPILADGIRWFGYLPRQQLVWSLGFFHDWQSEVETFSKDEHQVAARFAWVSLPADSSGVLHLGLNGKFSKPDDDRVRLRSRPESFSSPFFVDTGQFPSTTTLLGGPEAYYQRGPWVVGSEYLVMRAESDEASDPVFHGGDLFVSRFLTPATRKYQTYGYFGPATPVRDIYEDGLGAIEAVLRVSYANLNGGTLEGGTFWRITPMLNWHLTRYWRLEAAYGYGILDRGGREGTTHFFQLRSQMVL